MIPQYLLGRHFGAAWNGNISGDSGFAAGPGGYQNREEFARDVMKQIPKDKLDDDNFFKFINANITAELVNNAASDPDGIKIAQGVMKKTLAVFFGSVPGAYVINGELGDRSQPVSFELTETGKQFLKGRVQRETNGSFGAYGFRKMRQLYGVTTGKRQPAAAESPLVSPVG